AEPVRGPVALPALRQEQEGAAGAGRLNEAAPQRRLWQFPPGWGRNVRFVKFWGELSGGILSGLRVIRPHSWQATPFAASNPIQGGHRSNREREPKDHSRCHAALSTVRATPAPAGWSGAWASSSAWSRRSPSSPGGRRRPPPRP